jgi:glutaredoxin 2
MGFFNEMAKAFRERWDEDQRDYQDYIEEKRERSRTLYDYSTDELYCYFENKISDYRYMFIDDRDVDHSLIRRLCRDINKYLITKTKSEYAYDLLHKAESLYSVWREF